MNLKTVGIGLVVAFGLWFVLKSQGKKITSLKSAVKDSSAALVRVRSEAKDLEKERDGLKLDKANLGQENASLRQKASDAKAVALSRASELSATQSRLRLTASQLNAIQAKRAADEEIGGIGAINTTTSDSVTNRQFAALKSQIRHLESVVADLQETVARLQAEKSELEVALNGRDSELNAKLKQLADVRSLVQAKRAEARGLFAKKRNRVLGEVDQAIGELQK